MPMNDLTSLKNEGTVRYLIASTFLGSGLIPSQIIMEPKEFVSDSKKLHFFNFSLKSCFGNLSKIVSKCC